MIRANLVGKMADLIAGIHLEHPVRVGIDGVDAAGKTTLAKELIKPLEQRGRHVIRASIDGFHNPQQVRLRRGSESPEGYYYGSFNHESLISRLLDPLGPNGARRYREAIFDFRKDTPVDSRVLTAPPDAVLLFEGLFLHRPELLPYWDFTIFLRVDFDVTIERAVPRDENLFGSEAGVRERYAKRYIPGQQIYLDQVRPDRVADIVVDNNDWDNPRLDIV
jgi:uridine kinase